MNNLIKLQQETSVGTQRIHIDTSSEYKDFIITEYDKDGNETFEESLQIQMNEQELLIGKVQLNKLGIKLLKEFLNQLNTEL